MKTPNRSPIGRSALALAILVLAGLAIGADGQPKLLSQTPAPPVIPASGPADRDGGYCPPPPPVAASLPEADDEYCPEPPAAPAPAIAAVPAAGEEICPPPPPCPPAIAAPAVTGRARTVTVTETVAVPARRRVVEEECYVVEEKRTELIDEVRTREAERRVPALRTRQVSEAKIVKVASGAGRATRLARGVSRKVEVYKTTEVEKFTETYIAKVPNTYTVPVIKSRKVPKMVDDVKYVTRRVRVPVPAGDFCPEE
jgi:hypothetical protein